MNVGKNAKIKYPMKAALRIYDTFAVFMCSSMCVHEIEGKRNTNGDLKVKIALIKAIVLFLYIHLFCFVL